MSGILFVTRSSQGINQFQLSRTFLQCVPGCRAQEYNQFLLEAGAVSSEYYKLAQYNLGYAYFRKKDYRSAIFRFRQFISNAGPSEENLKFDAVLRTADSSFITRDYRNAVEFYDMAIQ